MSWADSEAEVASPMVDHLRGMRWEVFQEVQLNSGRVDIVARRHGVYHGLEVKRSFGFPVLNQAILNRKYFHYTSIVIPATKSTRGRKFGASAQRAVREKHGLGCWLITERGEVREKWSPRLHRNILDPADYVDPHLFEAQKHYEEAGSASGSYWSPWKENCRRVRDYVRENPGCTVRDLLDEIDHHYSADSTFKSCVVRDVRAGKIDGVTITDEREAKFYPSEEPTDDPT